VRVDGVEGGSDAESAARTFPAPAYPVEGILQNELESGAPVAEDGTELGSSRGFPPWDGTGVAVLLE